MRRLWHDALIISPVAAGIFLLLFPQQPLPGIACLLVTLMALGQLLVQELAASQREANQTRDQLRQIQDALNEALLMVSADGRVTLASARLDQLGVRSADLLQQHLPTWLNRSGEAAARLGFPSTAQAQAFFTQAASAAVNAYSLQQGDQTRRIERIVHPQRGSDGAFQGWLFIFRDITAAHDAAQTRDEFSNMFVHDLRSPLTAVNTGLKLLRDLIPTDGEAGRALLSTAEASQRALHKVLARVDSLLDISRIQNGRNDLETESRELNTLVQNVLAELSPLAREMDVRLVNRISADLPLVEIDADKIERVLQNLVDNALKYSPSHSQVTVQARLVDAELRVEVIDQGPGVADEQKQRLFEPFVQVRRSSRRGTGLGLTFCKLIIEAHSGRIWVEDNPDGGSVFSFTLPMAETPQPVEA